MFDRIIRYALSIFVFLGSLKFLYTINVELNGNLAANKPISHLMVTVISIGFGVSVYFLSGIALKYLETIMERFWIFIQNMTLNELIFSTFGLISGLVVANLLGTIISRIPFIGIPAAIAADILFGALGILITIKKRCSLRTDDYSLINTNGNSFRSAKPKILDTSVIIDGRIVDICKTGFIEGPLIIPGIVLEELRHIADSSDNLKRNRGRRGLDVLNIIQKELNIPVEIYEIKVEDEWEVDIKLLKIAQRLQGAILTNDFNLNKVASVHRVPVLNINELANSLKPIVLPGEEMVVSVIKSGKENGQGIGYLDDGTMIVVEGGRRHMGEDLGVIVTSVLQTAAGRMIFAKPKYQIGKAI